MYKITLQLTNSSIDQAIAKLEQLKQEVQEATHKLLKYIADSGVKIAKANVKNIDTGATKSSIKAFMYVNQDKAVIIAGGNAVWLEFGTGVHYNKPGSYPLSLPSGIVDIGQYGKKNGLKDGWIYPTTDPRYELTDEYGNGLGIAYTHGLKANRFMYKALCKIRDNAPQWAIDIFKGI